MAALNCVLPLESRVWTTHPFVYLPFHLLHKSIRLSIYPGPRTTPISLSLFTITVSRSHSITHVVSNLNVSVFVVVSMLAVQAKISRRTNEKECVLSKQCNLRLSKGNNEDVITWPEQLTFIRTRACRSALPTTKTSCASESVSHKAKDVFVCVGQSVYVSL